MDAATAAAAARWGPKVLGWLTALVAAFMALVLGLVLLVVTAASGQADGGLCASSAPVGALSAEQSRNARIVTATATTVVDGPDGARAAAIAVMVALTESSLVNVGHGDAVGPDSRGLFQQRDSWGPLATRMDPKGATTLFLRVLVQQPGWQSADPWRAAQAVQRSAFSDGSNYRVHWDRALSIVAALDKDAGITECTATPAGGGGARGGAPGTEWGGFANGRIDTRVLCTIPWAPGHLTRCDYAVALLKMNQAYRAKFGSNIVVTSSYRSYEQQAATCAGATHACAAPGKSRHGLAMAIDFGGGVQSYGSPQYRWFEANAPRYGILHPPWALQPGPSFEPWHWEFDPSIAVARGVVTRQIVAGASDGDPRT